MGTKWSAVTITGFNSSPPSDDGTASGANQVKWSTVLGKIGSPLNTGLSAALTKLDALFTETPNAQTSNYTTVASDHNKVIQCSGSFTLTLLAPSTAGAAYRVTAKNNGSGTITVNVDGGSSIDGSASILINPKRAVTFEVNAAADAYYWHRSGTVLQIVHQTDAGSSHSSATYANLNVGAVAIVPRHAASKILIECAFEGLIDLVASTNTVGTFQIYETPATGVGFEPILTASAESQGVACVAPCFIRHMIASSGVASRSFALQGKTSSTSAPVQATKMVWTITEYLA